MQIEIKDTSKVLKSKLIKILYVLSCRSEERKQLNKRRTKYVNNYLLKSMKYLTAINGALCGPLALNFYGWKTKAKPNIKNKLYQEHKLIEFRINLNSIMTTSMKNQMRIF